MRELDRFKVIQSVVDGQLKPSRAAERFFVEDAVGSTPGDTSVRTRTARVDLEPMRQPEQSPDLGRSRGASRPTRANVVKICHDNNRFYADDAPYAAQGFQHLRSVDADNAGHKCAGNLRRIPTTIGSLSSLR